MEFLNLCGVYLKYCILIGVFVALLYILYLFTRSEFFPSYVCGLVTSVCIAVIFEMIYGVLIAFIFSNLATISVVVVLTDTKIRKMKLAQRTPSSRNEGKYVSPESERKTLELLKEEPEMFLSRKPEDIQRCVRKLNFDDS